MPISLRRLSVASVAAASSTSALSVISTHRRSADIPAFSSVSTIVSTARGWLSCRGEKFTATRSGSPPPPAPAPRARMAQLPRREVHGHTERLAVAAVRVPSDGLGAGLLEHAATERDDQAALLGDRDEVGRRDDPALR